MDSQLRLKLDAALLVLTGAAALAIVLDVTGPLRHVVVFAAVLLVPGSAFGLFLGPTDLASFVGLAVGLSLGIGVVGPMLLIWLGWWQPLILGIVVATISCSALIVDIRRISSSNRGALA